MFDIINVPLGWIIKVCYQLTDNYAIALLLFALVLQIVLLPFVIKQQKNSVKQASLRPKEQAIRKKYAGRTDKVTQQKMQNEIMDLYQRENFNPMGGCLPLLIQMPILFALFNVVVSPLKYICGFGETVVKGFQAKIYEVMSASAVEGFEAFAAGKPVREIDIITKMREYMASGVEFIGENGEVITAEMLPDFNLWGDFMDLSQIPSFNTIGTEAGWLLLIPLFTLIVTLGSTFITRKFTYQPNPEAQNDMSMKIMQLSMPLLSVYITFTISAAVGLYWIFRNILSTIQQIVMSKVIPIPKFTEADYKAAEKELNIKPKKEKKEKVRSLHRIDEEDDEEPAEVKENTGKPELKEGVNESDAPKLKDESDRETKKQKNTEDK